MTLNNLFVALSALTLLTCTAAAAAPDTARDEAPAAGKQVLQHFPYKTADGKDASMAYWLWLPPGKPEGKQPMLLFLHGSGERGNDPAAVKKHGPPKLAGSMKELEPLIIISPQCPAQQWWDLKVLKSLCDSIQKSQPVDPDRVYLTGLSMGGFGTWGLLAAHPDYWAAAMPICGGGEPKSAAKFKDVPLWIFHGAKDPAVPIKASEEMVAALKEAGAEPKFTVYPDLMHDCWTTSYQNPETWKWLLAQKRKAPAK